MSGILQESTDPELKVMKDQTEAKLAAAEKGAGKKSTGQDTDAGIAMAVALSAVTGGISNIVDVVMTTLQEVKSAPTPSASMPGSKPTTKKSVSRFTDSAPEVPKQQSVNLMSPMATRPIGAKPTVTAAKAANLDGGDIKLAKQSLAGISGAKASPGALVHAALDTAKLKFKLGAIKSEIEKDADVTVETQVLSRRDQEKLNRGVDSVEKKIDTAPKVAEKIQIKKPQQPPALA